MIPGTGKPGKPYGMVTMISFLTAEMRRNPYPVYDQLRSVSPLFRDPATGLRMVLDYDGVQRLLTDHEAFSARHGPVEWLVLMDPPRHTKLRALISQGFTPRSIANLEPRIRELSSQLLDSAIDRHPREMDLAKEFSIPLPMRVIGGLLGIPASDHTRFTYWNDVILDMSYTVGQRDDAAKQAAAEFTKVTREMNDYLTPLLDERRVGAKDDLLSRLARAQVDGEQLTKQEILGFFQLLLVAGQETTTNLINNAMLCFMESPDQLALLRQRMDLLPGAIEEVLRYRAPFQWMFRLAAQNVELHGQLIRAGELVIAVMGSANRDPKQFEDPNRFDIARDPNPHIAFGHGQHFCLGAPLARLEAKIALADILKRMKKFELASNSPWEPRKGLHVHGPSKLPIRFS
jgi:cytochrome P450